MRIDRMLAIVVILLNRRKITAKELAQRFEVSLRTVYRDIEAINLAGIPVISLQGNQGGYEIPENYKLNKQYLSISDMRSILTGLQGVNATLDDDQIRLLLEKIQGLLPQSFPGREQGDDLMIIFDPYGWGDQTRTAEKVQQLFEMIKQQQLLQLDYSDSHGNQTIRQIEPMTLIQKGFAWYLYGWCALKKDFRLFKLTRIRRFEQLPQTFKRRSNTFKSNVKPWGSPGKQIEITLKYDIALAHLVDEYHDESQILSRDEHSVIVTDVFPDGEWLYGMILSHGTRIEVLAPDDIRCKVAERICRMKRLYDQK